MSTSVNTCTPLFKSQSENTGYNCKVKIRNFLLFLRLQTFTSVYPYIYWKSTFHILQESLLLSLWMMYLWQSWCRTSMIIILKWLFLALLSNLYHIPGVNFEFITYSWPFFWVHTICENRIYENEGDIPHTRCISYIKKLQEGFSLSQIAFS